MRVVNLQKIMSKFLISYNKITKYVIIFSLKIFNVVKNCMLCVYTNFDYDVLLIFLDCFNNNL